jgi:hypothetical protein
MNQDQLDQIREEAIRFCLEGNSSSTTSPERLDEWARRTEFERLETTAQIEARIKDLEAAIETRFDLYADKKKRNLLPPYYSDQETSTALSCEPKSIVNLPTKKEVNQAKNEANTEQNTYCLV